VYFIVHDSEQTDHESAKQLLKQNVGNCHTKCYVTQVTLQTVNAVYLPAIELDIQHKHTEELMLNPDDILLLMWL
jgi:hypothetical protein